MTKKRLLIVVGVLIVLFLLLRLYKNSNATTVIQQTGDTSPFNWPNGIYPSPQNMNGSDSPFQSSISVDLTNPILGMLSQKYIPLYGFVGVTAAGG